MDIRTGAARRTDLPDVYRVLESAFTDAPIQLFIDQTEGDSTLRMRHVRVAEVDGRITAHVRIFARRMLIRGVPISTGGIGSVASMPHARGLGLPSALLLDAVDVMARDGMAISFLFTGIPAFYERLGWRVVNQPAFPRVNARHAAAILGSTEYRVRRMTSDDLPALLSIHGEATRFVTGAVARTLRTWRDGQGWLGEDAGGCLVAEHEDEIVAYIRGRSAAYGYHVLEGEHGEGHEDAMRPLLAKLARRAVARRQPLYVAAPDDHALTHALRTLPRVHEDPHMSHPTMVRIVSLGGLIDALLPQLRLRARAPWGPPFTLGLRAPDGQSVTLEVLQRTVRKRLGAAQYTLDEAGTLDAVLGQRRASELVRAPAAVRRRIDALFPQTAFHFWDSDRI